MIKTTDKLLSEDKFLLEEVEAYFTDDMYVVSTLAKQLADTMRKNERLREAIQFFFDRPGDSEYDIIQCKNKFKDALSNYDNSYKKPSDVE